MPFSRLEESELQGLSEDQLKVARELDRLTIAVAAQVNTGYARARGWQAAHTVLSPLTATLAGAAGLTGISGLIGTTGAGVIALSAAVVAAAEGALNPAGRAVKARDDAESFIAVRDEIRQFAYLRLGEMSALEGTEQVGAFTKRLHEIGEKADPPGILMWRRIRRGSS
ncbi:hypothetical protein [Actinomycetospora chibensis]|uniref:SLATT domain-containing protein n=1 Tax=Actinomycetospora chibensis TaxID=663606 RepID=A0ABV9RLD5_9PSEU|nr:hypothetical protein [Actinomycetospora chibensis]MDD7922736.1 hypothetical protein [Actinomycetospora chibensis]